MALKCRWRPLDHSVHRKLQQFQRELEELREHSFAGYNLGGKRQPGWRQRRLHSLELHDGCLGHPQRVASRISCARHRRLEQRRVFRQLDCRPSTTLDLWVRHDAATPIKLGLRIPTSAGFPAMLGRFPDGIQPNTWTHRWRSITRTQVCWRLCSKPSLLNYTCCGTTNGARYSRVRSGLAASAPAPVNFSLAASNSSWRPS